MGNQCCSAEQVTMDSMSARPLEPQDGLGEHQQENDGQQFQDDEASQKQFSRNDVFTQYLHKMVEDKIEEIKNSLPDEKAKVLVSTTKIHQTIYKKLADPDSLRAHNLVSDGKYEDQDFKPVIESLTTNIKEFSVAKKVKWHRIDEILPQDQIEVFAGQIEPNDIYQGSLGDCYFLSALSTLAENPDLISRLFDTVEYNPEGYYSVWLNHDGLWKQIIIDDHFPCINKKPAFSKSHDNELWVMILEKAYANLFKSYHNIQAGLPEEAVTDLTGAPFEWINTKDVNKCWDFIFTKIEDEKINPKVKYIINAASNQDKEGGIEVKDNTGIISGHAYAVLDAKEVKSDIGKERIVQLRNPWGQSEWEGAWSDKSSKWTPELKRLCNYSDKNDGLFWMPIEDFCNKYETISCNYVYMDNYYNCTEITLEKKYAVVKFKSDGVNNTGYIQFHQKDRRNFKNFDDNYDYSQVRMLLFSGTPNNVKSYVGEVSSYQRSGFIKVNLKQQGEYFAVVQVDWEQQITRELVISSYTEQPIIFSSDEYYEEPDFLDECLVKVPPKKKGEEHVYKEDSQIFRYTNSSFGFLYFVYVNQSPSTTFSETVTLTKADHLQICAPFKDTNQFKVELKPETHKIVKYKILPEGHGGYSFAYKYSSKCQLSQQDMIERILKSESNKRARIVRNTETKVFFYSIFNSDGCAFYYQNNTDQTYTEILKLTLINLISEDGHDTSKSINLTIPPKSGQLLKFKEINPAEASSYKSSYIGSFK